MEIFGLEQEHATQDGKKHISNILYAMKNISSENSLFDESYYLIYKEELNNLINELKLGEREVVDLFSNNLKSLYQSLIDTDDIMTLATASILQLLTYPLLNDFPMGKRKTYKSFNIDIQFFENLRYSNTHLLYDESDGLIQGIDSFEFDNNFKLKSFRLSNAEGGVSRVYDKNYKIKKIVFPDGNTIKVPNKL